MTTTMKTLGLLGGMSWESTAVYYRLINEGVQRRLGGLHSAPIVMHSFDLAAVAALQRAGDWQGAAALLAGAACRLRDAGAQALVIATNTMHKVAAAVQAESGLPLLHIADATGAALARAGVRRPALLGTRFTLDDESIVQQRLFERHDIQCLLPDDAGRATLQRVIFDELCRGIVHDASRAELLALLEPLRQQGAQGVILGCTELMLLLGADDTPLPVFDTTALHAAAALDWMLGAQAPETGATR